MVCNFAHGMHCSVDRAVNHGAYHGMVCEVYSAMDRGVNVNVGCGADRCVNLDDQLAESLAGL